MQLARDAAPLMSNESLRYQAHSSSVGIAHWVHLASSVGSHFAHHVREFAWSAARAVV